MNETQYTLINNLQTSEFLFHNNKLSIVVFLLQCLVVTRIQFFFMITK